VTDSTEADCIFCRIAGGEVPAEIVHEKEDLVAFRDVNPQAPTHVLVIPRRHVPSLNEVEADGSGLMGRLMLAAREVADGEGLAGAGYRIVLNTGDGGGQTVHHIHLHLLGGRRMTWPPG
jgi:histidine triad (HIT) family protein